MKVIVAENSRTTSKGGSAGRKGKGAVVLAAGAVALLSVAMLPGQVWADSAVCVNAGSLGAALGSATGDNSVACGQGAEATGPQAMAVGTKAKAEGSSAVALGNMASSYGNNAVSIGWAVAGDKDKLVLQPIAIGLGAKATANYSTAIGKDAQSTGVSSIAIGQSAKATANYSTAIGKDAQSTGASSVAIGDGTQAKNANDLYIGTTSGVGTAGAFYQDAAGNYINQYDINNYMVVSGVVYQKNPDGTQGPKATATETANFRINGKNLEYIVDVAKINPANPNQSLPTTGNNIGIGNKTGNKVAGTGYVAMGSSAGTMVNGNNTVSIGTDANKFDVSTIASNSIAIGTNSKTSAQDAVAIGNNAWVQPSASGGTTADGSIAIGRNAQALSYKAIAVGQSAKVSAASSIAIGDGASANGDSSNISIGRDAKISAAARSNNTAIGANAKVIGPANNALALGVGAIVTGNNLNTAVGVSSKTHGDTTSAVGTFNQVLGGYDNVAVGANNIAGHGSNLSAAIGSGNLTRGRHVVAMGVGAATFGNNSAAIAASGNEQRVSREFNKANDSNESNFSIVGGVNNFAIGNGNLIGNTSKNNVVFGNNIKIGATSATFVPVTLYYSNLTNKDTGVVSISAPYVKDAGKYYSYNSGNAANGYKGAELNFSTYTISDETAYTDYVPTWNGLKPVNTAIAIGDAAKVDADSAIAIGTGAQATGLSSISIGTGNVVTGNNSGALGDPSIINGANSYSIGNNNTIGSTTSNAFAMGNKVYLGADSAGTTTTDVSGAVALGNASGVTVLSGVALGENSISSVAGLVAGYDPLTKTASTDTTSTWRSTGSAVSIGTDTVSGGAFEQTRQITGLAAGTQDTDAVNVAQLKMAQADATTHYYSVKSTNQAAGSNYANDGATGTDAMAAGVNTSAKSDRAIAVGFGATSGDIDGTYTISPSGNVASRPDDTIAIGTNAKSSAMDGIAIGHGAKVYQGWNYDANGRPVANNYGIAIGSQATAINNNIVVGNVGAGNTLAAGSNTNPNNINNVTIGNGAGANMAGNENVILGYQAGVGMSDAGGNVVIGKGAGENSKGGDSVAIGTKAGINTTQGAGNVAVGNEAGSNVGRVADVLPGQNVGTWGNSYRPGDLDGQNNTALGVRAGSGSAGSVNVAVGFGAGSGAVGFSNVGIGSAAGRLVQGSHNIAVGTESGEAVQGIANAAFGNFSGRNVKGSTNTALGSQAGNNVTGDNNVALGNSAGQNLASSSRSVGIGFNAGQGVAGNNNVAIGYNAGRYVTGIDNVAMGRGAGQGTAALPLAINRTVAMGQGSKAESNDSIAIGTTAVAGTSTGNLNAIAIGKGAQATGHQSISIGTGNIVSANNAGAFGDPNQVLTGGDGSYVIGNNNIIGTTDTFVLGNDVTATANNSLFFGKNSGYVVSDASRTRGLDNTYTSDTFNGVTRQFAGGNQVVGVVSVGNASQTRRIQNVAPGQIGANSTDAINGSQLFAMQQTVAAGQTHYYSVKDDGMQRPNYNNDGATGNNSLAAGVGASATGVRSTATGAYAKATAESSTAIGANAEATNSYATAVGRSATASGWQSTALGQYSTASNNQAVAIGRATASGASSLAIGQVAKATGDGSIAQGYFSSAVGEDAIALGTYSSAGNPQDVALGAYSITAPVVGTASSTINGVTYDYAGADPMATVSVGQPGYERTITNVAAGRVSGTSTDAINGSQLYATNQAISAIGAIAANANQGWDIGSSGGLVGNVAPGKQVNFVAGNANTTVGVTQDTTTGNSTVTVAAAPAALQYTSTKTAAGGNALNTDQFTPANQVTLVGAGNSTSGGVSLNNVAPAELSSTSLQAVNGSQFGPLQT